MKTSSSPFFVLHYRFLVPSSLFSVFCLLFLAACSPTAVPRANSIICHAAYRDSTGVPLEDEATMTFADEDAVNAVTFAELSFQAQYSSGEQNHERVLRLWVTEPGQTAELFSQLYQLPQDSGPKNQFVGGHGFTGLNYAHHPTTGAELQYWCTAE